MSADVPAETDLIPLFPLRSVLFPGGRLPLQIFEQRYIDLVSHCMKTDSGFGVCLVTKGDEVVKPGSQQQVSRTGMYARIVDWDQLPNGLLGITVEGQRKFNVMDCWPREDKLLMGSVQWSTEDFLGQGALPLSPEQDGLVDLLRDLMAHPLIESLGLTMDYQDQRQLGWRLSELLPVPVHQKQKLLEINDTAERLREIENLVVSVMRHNN
ncbi:MAG: LON peptidase substrate-binding domain-containing protein [Gammaproteobacteria bacterium]|nr:LON peptidase substrate-binding domain-containing protein [Gammaproteobacteria bacterium]